VNSHANRKAGFSNSKINTEKSKKTFLLSFLSVRYTRIRLVNFLVRDSRVIERKR